MHLNMYVYVCVYVCVCVCVCMCVCAYVYVCVRVCEYVMCVSKWLVFNCYLFHLYMCLIVICFICIYILQRSAYTDNVLIKLCLLSFLNTLYTQPCCILHTHTHMYM